MIPTYFILQYLVPYHLEKKRLLTFVVGVLASGFFILFMRLKWLEILNYLETFEYQSMPWTKVLKNTIRDYAIVALVACISIIADWRQRKKLNMELQESKAKVEVQLLKNQLHPHFLFNTLNNIYSLALKKSDRTADSILRLTNLLDYLVYWSDKEEVAIHKEVELIRNYCEMEALRYGDKLKLDIDMDDLPKYLKSSPLIFLPFVENSFKHGGNNTDGVTWVNIKLKYYDEKLVFNIENSVSAKKNLSSGESKGVGLDNIRKRLDIYYNGRYDLQIDDGLDHFTVRLELMIDEKA